MRQQGYRFSLETLPNEADVSTNGSSSLALPLT